MDLLQEVITKRLVASKTVFVSPLAFAHTDWGYFRRAMRVDRRARFARKYVQRDGSLEAYTQLYGFTKGLHLWHKNGVPRRVKAIVSNGMLGLWRRWKQLRLQLIQRQNLQEEFQWIPLSLTGSDLYYVFTLLPVCVLFTLGAFAVEIGVAVCAHIFSSADGIGGFGYCSREK